MATWKVDDLARANAEPGQQKAPAEARAEAENPRRKELLLRRLHLGVFPAEALHAAGGIQQLLLAGKERMAIGADFYVDVAPMGGAGGEVVAARAHDAHFVVCGMDSCLHGSPNRFADYSIL